MAPSARKFPPRDPDWKPKTLTSLVKYHNVTFKDHTGNPSLMSWSGSEDEPGLPDLPSWVFYMTNPEISRDFDGCAFVNGLERDDMHYINGGFRYEFFFLPSATAEECVAHYRGEMAARGTIWRQVRRVQTALKRQKHMEGEEGTDRSAEELSSDGDDEALSGIAGGERLPGLPWPKRENDWIFTDYRNWLFMYLDADIQWGPGQDHDACLVKFDPMPVEFEEGDSVRWDPMEVPIHSEIKKVKGRVGDEAPLVTWMSNRTGEHWARTASEASNDAKDLGWKTW